MDTNGHIYLCEDYVSFETAKLLKEKGFEDKCDYIYKNKLLQFDDTTYYYGGVKLIDRRDNEEIIPAPTQSLALKLLRKVHKIHIYAKPYWPQGDMRNKMSWQGFVVDLNTINGDSQCYADSPEEAIENRIRFALENLI